MSDPAFVIATDFLTIKALGTFTGASTATVLVGNFLRFVTKRDLLLIPFLVALVFAAVQAEIVGASWHDVASYLLIVLNGLLLFFTALGATQTLVSFHHPKETGAVRAQAMERRDFFTPWL